MNKNTDIIEGIIRIDNVYQFLLGKIRSNAQFTLYFLNLKLIAIKIKIFNESPSKKIHRSFLHI